MDPIGPLGPGSYGFIHAKANRVIQWANRRNRSGHSPKDSGRRQVQAIEAYAKRAGVELVGTFNDEAVKGSDPIDTRPGFAAMLEALEANGTKTIVVETANRFARDLMVQEVGYAMLRARGIDLIAADSPTSFLDDTPTARLIRQVLGAVSEFEKAMLVAKLKGARDRKRRNGVKVEGRKSIAEQRPETVELARLIGPGAPQGRQAFAPRGIGRTCRGRSHDQVREAIRGHGNQAHVE